VWSRAPEFDTPLLARTCWIRSADEEALARIGNLHDLSRREVQRPDARSPRALAAIQGLLDVTLDRCGSGHQGQQAREAQRLQLAEQWMRRHLDVRAPAGALADYLGISPMGLQRLFRQAVGLSPGRAFHELRMREASVLLARPGASVKAVALGLGYRHPGDFTRAFTRFHGHPPSTAPRQPVMHRRS
jgi:AraC-like DNA-binding protein